MLEVGRQQFELRPDPLPLVQRRLQRRREMGGVRAPGEVAADHDQPAVAAMFHRAELHLSRRPFPSFQRKPESPCP
jgi:hypothetical protein